MLRITSTHHDGIASLRLEGSLAGMWVEETRTVCAREVELGRRLALDLSEVRFVDPEGARFLRQMVDAGLVARSSSYVTELLRLEGS